MSNAQILKISKLFQIRPGSCDLIRQHAERVDNTNKRSNLTTSFRCGKMEEWKTATAGIPEQTFALEQRRTVGNVDPLPRIYRDRSRDRNKRSNLTTSFRCGIMEEWRMVADSQMGTNVL